MAVVILPARRGPVERTLGILELVAERGGEEYDGEPRVEPVTTAP